MSALLKRIFSNLCSAPATRRYPAEKRELCAGARGQIDIRIQDCVFCGLCQKRCPTDAITVSRQPKSWTLNPHRCIICSYCVEVCPKKCIVMNTPHRAPSA